MKLSLLILAFIPHLGYAMESPVAPSAASASSAVLPSQLIQARAKVVRSLRACIALEDDPAQNIGPVRTLQIRIQTFAHAAQTATHLSPQQRKKHAQEIAAIEKHGPQALAHLELPQETQTPRPSAAARALMLRYSHSAENLAQLNQKAAAKIPKSGSSCPNLPSQIREGDEQSTHDLPVAVKLADNQYNFAGRPKYISGERFFEE